VAADLPDDAQRALLNQRRDLEREFEGKLRDLKAQHKRQMDRLEADRADWEESRRRQAKELADRAERLRRQEANETQQAEAAAAEAVDAAGLRAKVEEQRAAKLDLKQRLERAEGRLTEAAEVRRKALARVRLVGVGALLAAALWLWSAWSGLGGVGVGAAVALLALGALALALR
jgi:type IV secretory pathway VirB10-like protein